ncbi:MAG: hypothetical protein GXP55_04575 [Deltaproteobacteria bacterium]|nr:hypothetical protein [Deltaproteobacteria bacterium]
MTSSRRALVVSVLLSFALGACGGKKAPPPPPPADTGPRDAGIDSSRDGAIDSGRDGSVDGSTLGDGGAGEVFPGCTETIFEEIDLGADVRGFQQTVSVAPSASSWGLAWSDASDAFENIRARVVPSSGGLGMNRDVTTGFAISEGAAILSTGSGFLAAYYDNSDFGAGYEIYVRGLDSSGAPTAEPVRLSNNTVRDDNPTLLRMGTANLVVWVEDDMTNRVAKGAIISDAGAIMGSVQTLTTSPESPSLLTLGPLAGGAGLVWTEANTDGTDAVMLRVDSSARLVAGSKIVLSTEHNASGGVDLATDDVTGGAAVFDVSVEGVRAEVRFREIGADGTLPAPERIVSVAPATGRDASLAPLAGGYVVAYRALPDGTITEPRLRLTLLDVRGDVLSSFDGPAMLAQGGRTTVRVAGDGRVLVAWEDQDTADGSRRMRAVRVRCAADGPIVDGGMPDGGTDAGVDGSVDGGPDGGGGVPDGGIDPCDAITTELCGAGDACPTTQICLDDGCGGRRCVDSGRVCSSRTDCPAGSSCAAAAGGGVCVNPTGGCTDSRDCPLGFACEADACVDRRSPCSPALDCPRGYTCTGLGVGVPFCVPVHIPCDGSCTIGECFDVDGDGDTECIFGGECLVSSECPTGQICGSVPAGTCGDFGPCNAASGCPSGEECIDLASDGVPVCVPTGGTCSNDTDCALGQICAVPLAGGPPRCI